MGCRWVASLREGLHREGLHREGLHPEVLDTAGDAKDVPKVGDKAADASKTINNANDAGKARGGAHDGEGLIARKGSLEPASGDSWTGSVSTDRRDRKQNRQPHLTAIAP